MRSRAAGTDDRAIAPDRRRDPPHSLAAHRTDGEDARRAFQSRRGDHDPRPRSSVISPERLEDYFRALALPEVRSLSPYHAMAMAATSDNSHHRYCAINVMATVVPSPLGVDSGAASRTFSPDDRPASMAAPSDVTAEAPLGMRIARKPGAPRTAMRTAAPENTKPPGASAIS